MGSLRSFIKAVRKAKTIADERAVIKKESAAIRTSFRDSSLDQTTRRINISKLLYLYIMGEKTHFGQVECLKLLASPRFADKRLGYLATMLLLDENQEVLTLLTNSLDNDMQHPNSFIVGLALSCLGSIASPELARDLYGNVETILNSNNNFLKKKASIVAAKLIERDPDLSEIFLPRVTNLLADKLSSTLLGALRLVQSLYYAAPENRPTLLKLIPKLIEHIKRVNSSGYMPEYDVMGVTDPFLQVYLLTTLRILVTDEGCPDKYLDLINDILTQVASNIDGGKNSAHSILYECVKTIFAIKSDQSLKILGVNLLGKFLLAKDNNTRYVALDSLLSVINIEPQAVQRHRSTIVSCLSDGDISIRRRALELSFGILNEQNIRVLVREILHFLENSQDGELKFYTTSQLTMAANKFSPNEKWHFDTLTKMLKLAGNYVSLDLVSHILALIMLSNDTELKKHVITKLLSSTLEDTSQLALSMVTIWCVGEFAELILGSSIKVNSQETQVNDQLILKLIDQSINNTTYSESETSLLVSYILTAIIKLSIKLTNADSIEQLRLIINSKTTDNNLEIQTRAVEFQEIFGQSIELKRGLLAKMPPPVLRERQSISLHKANPKSVARHPSTSSQNNQTSGIDNLLDLLDESAPAPSSQTVNNSDLLSDIFGNTSISNQSKPPTSTTSTTQSNNAAILDLFDSPLAANSSSQAVASVLELKAYLNSNVNVVFIPKSMAQNGHAIIEAKITGVSPLSSIDKFQLLIAVPKTQKLTISSTSGGDSLTNGNVIKQVLKIVGKQGSKIKLRVKAKYLINGQQVEDLFDFAGFDQTL